MRAEADHLRLESLGLDLGGFSLRDVDLSCAKGEYHILLGPTGSGKSSLVRCILGLHRVDRGRILLAGRDITRELPERRRMGYVPQDYALFPHLDAERNIRFGIAAGRTAPREAKALLDRLCALLSIEKLRKRDVSNLSGGERQKVALARALGTRPRALLLDEPFSAIDERSKRWLWFELKEVIAELGLTTLHITHNLEEACVMGERLSVLFEGRLEHSGTSQEILENPANERVARFLDYRNIFTGPTRREGDVTVVELDGFDLRLKRELPEGRPTTLCIRQQDIKIIKEGRPIREELIQNILEGRIVKLFLLAEQAVALFQRRGSTRAHDLELRFPVHLMTRHKLHAGKQLRIAILEPRVVVFADSPSAVPEAGRP